MTFIYFCAWLTVGFVACISAVNTTPKSGGSVPHLDVENLESGYHGLVKENETLVEVTPRIRALGANICSFRIVNKHHGEAPFEILLKGDGEAELRARKSLNCEKRKNYKFDIAAVSCTGQVSDNATVHISVVDINEYPPSFIEPSYVKQVDEGRLYNEIVRVEATDRDCTPKYGDVCKYEILTSDQPFTIDNEGAIRNTEPLDYERSHNHILSVVAYDCGMRQSLPVMVTIKVNRVCKLGWRGIPERIDYAAGTGREELLPCASLDLCDVPCTVSNILTRINLATSHIGKGCDRDTYSVQSQRKLCGASKKSIDLLPSPGLATDWTRTLATDEGRESDEMFEFDGANAAVAIPNGVVDHNLSATFTVSVWLKHKHVSGQEKHVKEHVLCSADDHKMNRHHFAFFVRNCRLILLLRRDFSEGDLNIFRPAEWRWKIPQVCDNEWHHYAVSVKFPQVDLYLDGQLFKAEKKNPEIIDDWPLHPTKGINTTLTVGACWQGSENKMKHHFLGYMAGLSILLGETEKPEVLACLHKCKETLEVPSVKLLEPGMELMTNSDLTELSIEGDNKTNLETLVRKVGYINSREFPTPGRRNVHISTQVTCDSGRAVKVPPVETYIMVLQPQTPTIEINGTANIAREYEDFRQGVRVFTDVHILVSTQATKHEKVWRQGEPMSVVEKKLDSCSVSVYPSLNPDHETMTLPENMVSQLGITAKVNKDGALITGADIIYNYQQVLRHIQYTNRKPAYYLNRVFKLICTELNGRFTSNEYVQTLTVIHPRVSPSVTKAPATHKEEPLQQQQHQHQVAGSKKTEGATAHTQYEPSPNLVRINKHTAELRPSIEEYIQDRTQAVVTGGSHAVTIIIVVCVGFLLFMIVLGVVRIRSAHHHNTHAMQEMADSEMAWDDSALTITVNPMDNLKGGGDNGGGSKDSALAAGVSRKLLEREEELSCSDSDSCLESSDDECEQPSTQCKGLEWDNSTLAI